MCEKTLNLVPSILPALKAGSYRLAVTQNNNIAESKIAPSCFPFEVKTNPFTITAEEVYSVYPPKNSCGNYQNCLPHVVLHRRTHPWERTLRIETDPWLALFVFAKNDAINMFSAKYSELLPADQVLSPELPNLDLYDKDSQCRVVEFSYDLFCDLLPQGEDLPFSAHVRGVNLDNKVTDSQVKDNWFSCLIANRFPYTPEQDGETMEHVACLVSLEGFDEFIYNPQKRIESRKAYTSVRMIALFQWTFQTKSQGDYNFYSLSNKLQAKTFKCDFATEDKSVNNLIDLGYTPLSQKFREGSESVSWYHSPFLPQKSLWNNQARVSFFPDELLEYDPEMGMFDISYSAAWQLGRLLALADKNFSKKILSWRLDQKKKAVKQQAQKMLRSKLRSSINAFGNEHGSEDLKEIAGKLCKGSLETIKSIRVTDLQSKNTPLKTIKRNDVSQTELLEMLMQEERGNE